MLEIERTIRRYLNASAGTANHPTDYTFRCFVGMIETGEAEFADFRRVGGQWLEVKVREFSEQLRRERELQAIHKEQAKDNRKDGLRTKAAKQQSDGLASDNR